MTSDAEDVTGLHDQLTAAQQKHAVASAVRDREQVLTADAREALRAEFGVSTVDEAARLLEDLRGQLRTEAGEVRRRLEQAGGSL